MIIPDYEKLMEPYSKDGCTVELLVKWLNEKSQCTPEIISLALRNLFTELAQGRTFFELCDCGCGNKEIHNAMNHHVMRTAKVYQEQANREYWKVVEKADHERIIKHMELENAAYTAKNIPTLGYRLAHSRPVRWFKKPPSEIDTPSTGM